MRRTWPRLSMLASLITSNSESSSTPTTSKFQLIPSSFTNTLAARGLPLLSIILLVKISLSLFYRNFVGILPAAKYY